MKKLLILLLSALSLTAFAQQNQDEYRRIEKSLSVGYVQMGNLLVTIPDFTSASYYDACKRAKKCRLGGYSDWRLPTQREITTIFQTSRKYHDICPKFPDYRGKSVFKRKRNGGEYYKYWCHDKYYYEVNMKNGEAKVSFGRFTRGTMDDVVARECYFFFVR